MDEQVYRCENCGGIMEFDAKTQSLKCPNCDTTISIQNNQSDIIEHSFTGQAVRTYTVQEKTTSTMKCSGCGATIEVAADATAAQCPYCGSSYVMADKQEASIIPDGVIPFKIDTNGAKEVFGRWIKKLKFAPSSLKNLYQSGGIQGRYIPYWTFDADCHGSYRAMGGRHRTEHYRDKDGNQQTRTVTDWYPTSGRLDHFFDDVLVSATNNFKASLINGMDSYNTGDVVSYSPKYFSGYLSESYTVDLQSAHNIAVSEMDSALHSMARQDVLRHYDEVKDVYINVRYDSESYKHIFVPLYATSYAFKDKNYTVLINGQNGDIKGEYPKSPAKIAILIAVIIAIIAAIVAITSSSKKKNVMAEENYNFNNSGYAVMYEGEYEEIEVDENGNVIVDTTFCEL